MSAGLLPHALGSRVLTDIASQALDIHCSQLRESVLKLKLNPVPHSEIVNAILLASELVEVDFAPVLRQNEAAAVLPQSRY